ncbi:hypothetical protein EXE43_20250, partial [Halorubrum sp. SS5]
MTNDNTTRKKANAVFFAAVMVISMVAAGFAAAPAAAAADGITLDSTSVQTGTDVSGDVSNDSATDDTIYVVIDEDGDGEFDDGESNLSVAADSSGSTAFSGLSTDGLSEGDYDVYAFNESSGYSLSDGDAIDGEASTTLTIDNSGPSIRKATHYENSSGPVLELAIANGDSVVDDSAEAYAVFENGTEVDISGTLDFSDAGSGQVVADVSSFYNDITEVKVNGIDDTAGNSIEGSSDNATVSVTVAPDTVTPTGSDSSTYRGTNLAVQNTTDLGDTFTFDGAGIDRTRGAGPGSNVYVLDTDDLEIGTLNISDGGNNQIQVDIESLGLDVESDEEEFTTNDDVTATVTADDINRDVEAVLLNSDGDETDYTASGTIDTDGNVVLNFGQIASDDIGEYEVEVTDVDSGVTATSGTFNVTEAAEGDVSFEQGFVTEDRGDVANITINFQGDIETATLRVGDDDEVGYESNITVDSGGEDSVTVGFNTYVAGNTSSLSIDDLAYVVDADSDAEVTGANESVNDLANMLATGTYPLALSSEN